MYYVVWFVLIITLCSSYFHDLIITQHTVLFISVFQVRSNSVWQVEPNIGEIPAEEQLQLQVTACLTDCVRLVVVGWKVDVVGSWCVVVG